MFFDLTDYPYPSRRRVILSRNYAVATSQSLATLAGIEMFLAGGNAIDAAIASAITLTVVEPTANGIGGDAQAIVWDGNKLHGFNGSGKSPANLPLKAFEGFAEMPSLGWLCVTVPGAVSLWRTLWEKWGKLPFDRLFAPAIRHASEGFPVSPVTATAWKTAESVYLPLVSPEYQPFKSVFFPKDRSPYPGEIWGSIDHARTLEEIARSGGESFYTGDLARKIVDFASFTGGYLSLQDLANHRTLAVDPISTRYRDLEIWELPPNTQGIAALLALNILEGFDMARFDRDSPESFHRQIEAMKLAFADVYPHVSDPDFMEVGIDRLLDKTYAGKRRESIGDKAIPLAETGLPRGGTVYLATGDRDLMVSFIQSNYSGFGSGILVPETGIALHNRGTGFTLETGHPNRVAPNKRPFHTIIPAFLRFSDGTIGPMGVMGAPMQPQGHVQMAVNMADYLFNPQTALDAPRWRFLQGNSVLLERGVAPEVVRGLLDRGHNVEIADESQFGKGQIILQRDGILLAASESRSDGLALGG
ncbi:gamma-glutamyltransferase family protein [Pannus brasiliensis CCIBt3594]|uniref:Gamma-glutamyltransferase family protein n=1 Tax=Pannus brasiliensis CCIBt3594 TaxID=1427578 RepID=A0AAW9R132_9CHRO